MNRLTALLICILFAGCFASTDPPDPDSLDQVFPQASLYLSGFEGGSTVLIRFHTANNVYTVGSETGLIVTGHGSFLYTHSFEGGADSFSVLIVLDEDGDGRAGPGERAYYQPDIAFDSIAGNNRYGSNGRRLARLDLEAGDFTLLEELSVVADGLAADSLYYCFFAPSDAGDWRSRSLLNDNQGQRRPFADWFLKIRVETGADGEPVSTHNTALIPNIDYIPVCLDDEDRSGGYTNGEVFRTLDAFFFDIGEEFTLSFE